MRSDPAIVPLFGMGVCKFVATDWCGLVCRRGNYPSQLAGEGGFLLCATVTACECRIPLGRICRRCKPVKAQPLSLSLLPSAVRNCTRESKAHQFTCVSSFSFLRLFFSPPPIRSALFAFLCFFFSFWISSLVRQMPHRHWNHKFTASVSMPECTTHWSVDGFVGRDSLSHGVSLSFKPVITFNSFRFQWLRSVNRSVWYSTVFLLLS